MATQQAKYLFTKRGVYYFERRTLALGRVLLLSVLTLFFSAEINAHPHPFGQWVCDQNACVDIYVDGRTETSCQNNANASFLLEHTKEKIVQRYVRQEIVNVYIIDQSYHYDDALVAYPPYRVNPSFSLVHKHGRIRWMKTVQNLTRAFGDRVSTIFVGYCDKVAG